MPTRDVAPLGAPCWVDLFTNDMAAARSFYGDLFGWQSDDAGEDFGHYINFSKDGVAVAGGMANSDPDHPADFWNVYLAVADIAATAAAATASGAQTILAPMPVGPIGHMAVVADPGGAAIGMWQPAEFAGFGVIGEPGAAAWFELHTNAYDASVAFYKDVFGWDAHTLSDTPEFRYTTLGGGEDQLAGIMDSSVHAPEGAPSFWAVYFSVEDTDAALAKVVELGGSVIEEAVDTPYGRLAVAADTTGSSFRLIAEIA